MPISRAASFALGILTVPSNNWIKVTRPLSYEIIVYVHQAPQTTAKLTEVEHRVENCRGLSLAPQSCTTVTWGDKYPTANAPFSSFSCSEHWARCHGGWNTPGPQGSSPSCAPPALPLWSGRGAEQRQHCSAITKKSLQTNTKCHMKLCQFKLLFKANNCPLKC